MSVGKRFTEDELVVIFEAALAALGDADTFDRLVMELDLSDDEMVRIRDKLHNVMDETR